MIRLNVGARIHLLAALGMSVAIGTAAYLLHQQSASVQAFTTVLDVQVKEQEQAGSSR